MPAARMPAEWEPHRRTWMCWPCRAEAWPDGLARARAATADVARAIAGFEPVLMAARPQDADQARAATGLEVFETPLDDSWARDIGPTFTDGGAVGWRFNAWGGKYHPFAQDAGFAARAAAHAGAIFRRAEITCEGGALHSNGAGAILTTEQCLLNPNRNPGASRGAIERALGEAIGARQVIWLGEGFSDAETDGHVDNIACFTGPRRVLLGVPDAKSHPDHAPVMEARRRLLAAGLEVVELAQPRTLRQDRQGRLLQASYVNFYLCNGGLVMPQFGDANDEKARATLAACFPDRDIKAVPALDIVAGGGGIHCITQQEPA